MTMPNIVFASSIWIMANCCGAEMATEKVLTNYTASKLWNDNQVAGQLVKKTAYSGLFITFGASLGVFLT